ncbi:hypothetical protein ACIBCT_39085 [Streptosporangium sp. NPDC050855]|uniref:hypothetical protein n=1 Tax=Streptosporangium sp. NPDC050855 TaxID=3366194 RepID=UPI0037AE0376
MTTYEQRDRPGAGPVSSFETLPTPADQSRTFLTAAEARDCWPTGYSGNLNYFEAVHALRDAQLGAGHATLAVSAELAKLREDLANLSPRREDLVVIAQAVRELTGTIALLARPVDLDDVTNSIADVRTEVADVGAAVRELADAIRTQPPRRGWFSRWREAS